MYLKQDLSLLKLINLGLIDSGKVGLNCPIIFVNIKLQNCKVESILYIKADNVRIQGVFSKLEHL